MPMTSTHGSALPRDAKQPGTQLALQKQPRAVRVLHWTTATLTLAMLASGLLMVRMDEVNPMKYEVLYVWHQSIGILALAVVNLRLLVRLRSKLIPLPPTMAKTVRHAASAVYGALYGLMLLIPLAGLVMSAAYPQGQGTAFFGLMLPSFLTPNEAIYQAAQAAHWALAYAFGSLVLMHLGAAVKHRYFDCVEHDVLRRML